MKRFFLIGVFCLFSFPATVQACFCLRREPAFEFNLPPPGTGGNLSGLIYADVKAGKDMPLANVRVKISNDDGQVIAVFTDRRGEFEVKQLKPGKYTVEPEFPANYTSENKLLQADVDDRGTADVTFVAYMDGRVSGRVIDREGNSFNYASLELVSAGKEVSGLSTGEDGHFEIEGVPPGEYVLYMEMLIPIVPRSLITTQEHTIVKRLQ